jgi:hypothetical protein
LKTEETLRECGRWICHSLDIVKAILMRLIFALHATKGDYWYLLNMCGVNFLLIELIVTIVKRKGLILIYYLFEGKSADGARKTVTFGFDWSLIWVVGASIMESIY